LPDPSATERASGSLVKRVSDSLREDIGSGRFAVGDKLPSQSLLTERYDVSRTVVREAIASLQADGLLAARQGAGVFVTARQAAPAVAMSPMQNIDYERLSSVLEILELRTAVEVEAAGLAATRRSPMQEEAIFAAHQAFAALVEKGERSSAADFAFHQAIAAAANNPRFGEFLAFLGQGAIPRATLMTGEEEALPAGYLDKIVEEHRLIVQAISSRDEQAARGQMRTHLSGSQDRYRMLRQRRMP
jgi:DNA-binding FadR family transcriptional regulator